MLRAEEAAWPHRRYPLAELQKGPDRRALFETTFNYVHYHGLDALRARPDVELLGARYFDENSFSYFAQYSLDTVEGELVLELRYDPGEFTAEQAEAFAEASRTALAAMSLESREAGRRPRRFCPPGNSTWATRAGQAGPLPPGARRDCCTRRSSVRPRRAFRDAVALVDGPRRVTYAELAGRVHAWAMRTWSSGPVRSAWSACALERGRIW